MTNIRGLKKEIKHLASELIAECETYVAFHPETDRKKVIKINSAITEKEKSLIYEINHLKTKGDIASKVYLNRVIQKLKKEMLPLMDKIGETTQK